MTRKYKVLVLPMEYETKLTALSLAKSQIFYLPDVSSSVIFRWNNSTLYPTHCFPPYLLCEYPPQITISIHITSRRNSTTCLFPYLAFSLGIYQCHFEFYFQSLGSFFFHFTSPHALQGYSQIYSIIYFFQLLSLHVPPFIIF